MLDPITLTITPFAIMTAVFMVLLVTLFFTVVVQRGIIKELKNEVRYIQAKHQKRPNPPPAPPAKP